MIVAGAKAEIRLSGNFIISKMPCVLLSVAANALDTDRSTTM